MSRANLSALNRAVFSRKPLFPLLENRLGSIAYLMSVDIQRRYSFAGGIHPTGQAFLGTGCRLRDRMPSADVGLVN